MSEGCPGAKVIYFQENLEKMKNVFGLVASNPQSALPCSLLHSWYPNSIPNTHFPQQNIHGKYKNTK